jgi:hypothetical protein
MASKNLGDLVSRVLEGTNRNYNGVIFQKHRPPLDSEWNLAQDISLLKIAETLRKTTPSGFLQIEPMSGAPEDRNLLSAAWKNALKFKSPSAIVNGWIIPIGAGTNQFQENAQENIWKQLSDDEEECVVIGTQAPLSAHREDLLFLEVWQQLVTTSDNIPKYGNDQTALDFLENDLIDGDIEIETSKRVQIRYRLRWVEGVDFDSYRNGLGFPGAYAQGGLDQLTTEYYFTQHPKDPGLFWAGNGDSSQEDLNTVDGYTYAIPVARIHRKNRTAYSLTNQNGSAISLTSGNLSDRPDKKFYDEISLKDIEDLRHQISLDGFDYNRLLEENLESLWTRELKGVSRSPLDENVVGDKMIQVDGISTISRSGVDDLGRDPDSVKRAFSEAKEFQKVSFTIFNPQTNGGKVWFTSFGNQENSWEYEIFDENKYYLRPVSDNYEPLILEYDTATKTRNVIGGGTWENLGEYRTADFLTGLKNKATFTPADISQIQNKNIVIVFDFIVREGGGLSEDIGGFNYKIDRMLDARNEKDDRPVEFNLYTSISKDTELENPRTVGSEQDSAVTRSISRFEEATNPSNTFDEIYKGAAIEVKYHVLSTGSASDVVPNEVYGREVLGIYKVFNITASLHITPNIEKTVSGFEVDGLTVDTNDLIEYTLLLGTYTVDYVPHTRGLRNIAKTYIFSNSINVGDTEGVINVKQVISSCDAVIANCGFFNGSLNRFVAYINNEMIFLDDIEGLGTPVIKYTLSDPALVSGQIDIHMLGYYSPNTADQMYFQYEYTSYKGFIQNLLGQNDVQRVKVLKLDENVTTITAGTGTEDQKVPINLKDMAGTLPINKVIKEYNLFGSDIETPLSGGISSFRRVPGRGLSYKGESTLLKEGMVLDLALGDEDTQMFRGGIVQNPKISERGFDLNVPDVRDDLGNLNTNPDTGNPYDLVFETDMTLFNHVTQWSAIVEGLDELKGELLLMVITTISTVYNADECLECEYLSLKGLYEDEAFGKGVETILDNDILDIDITQELGIKVIGSVDLFPLKNKPLIIPTSN